MKILGITGLKQSGKDECAKQLKHLHITKTIVQINFADALKNELCAAFQITRDYLDQHKSNFRLIMQGYGTDYRRQLCGENYWTLKWLQKVNSLSPVPHYIICTDVRFLNEATVIQQCGGKLMRVTRPGVTSDGHASETEQDKIQTDFLVNNDGNITDLYNKIKNLNI